MGISAKGNIYTGVLLHIGWVWSLPIQFALGQYLMKQALMQL